MSLLTEGASLADAYLEGRGDRPVSSARGLSGFESWLDNLDLHAGTDPLKLARDTLEWMASCGVHSDHPRYFGLFNPPALVEGVLGDLIAGAVNPQLAVIEHAPVAAAIEKRLIDEFGALIGWKSATGHFTSGGSEANHTALLAALVRRYPQWAESGVPRSDRRPRIYASEHAHLAWIKLARMAGLGSEAVCLIPAASDLRMRGANLRRTLEQDMAHDPVLIVGTAGTTSHGAIDDLSELADVAHEVGAHFHVDAAWAGAALIASDLASRYAGIDRADSVTIDAHKWLAVPMGAGMYLTQDETALARAFAVTTDYMPPTSSSLQPYVTSIQWSRRFIGLKLFLALGSRGIEGYATTIKRQIAMGDLLRAALEADGWQICNDAWLPVICFCSPSVDSRLVAEDVVQSGEAWISTVSLEGRQVLRACITSPETGEREIGRLIMALSQARERARR